MVLAVAAGASAVQCGGDSTSRGIVARCPIKIQIGKKRTCFPSQSDMVKSLDG